VVRAESGMEKIKSALSDPSLESNVEFVIVKDLTTENAFDSLMENVKYVIHVASPMPHPVSNHTRCWEGKILLVLTLETTDRQLRARLFPTSN
jgi:hypothetical protein